MIKVVVITGAAKKDLKKAPKHVEFKLHLWARAVETYGLQQVRKVPGYHDEPLKGQRRGERSVRLSLQWRAIYVVAKDGSVQFVSVQEVTPHKY